MRENRPAPPTYTPVGVTAPADEHWNPDLPGFRRFTTTVRLGHGDTLWRRARADVLHWEVKQRSGFRVLPADDPEPIGGPAAEAPPCETDDRIGVHEGARYRIVARIGPLRIAEPAIVVAVVDSAVRSGFAYGTLPGHPVSGEEAFIVHRDADDGVHLTLRSMTAAAPEGHWRPAFPALLVAQRMYRRRYLRALTR